MPNVTMKGGSLTRLTSQPFNGPMAVPMVRPSMTEIAGGMP